MLEAAWIALCVWEISPDYLWRGLCLLTAAPICAYVVVAVEIGGARTVSKPAALITRPEEARGWPGGVCTRRGRDSKS